MEQGSAGVHWSDAGAYERYIGRWSRLIAGRFVEWLDVPPQGAWLDVACGTGALTQAILDRCDPARVDAFDLSAAFLERAAKSIADPRVEFKVADAMALPTAESSFDVVVCGLAINTTADPAKALAELVRSAKSEGVVAAYVWDFDGDMQMLRYFWESATALDADADKEAGTFHFALCKPQALHDLFEGAGLSEVDVRPIDASTTFRDFDDYWSPFLRGGAPAQLHVASLSEPQREALRERLRARLPAGPDGTIALTARAWAVKGLKR